MNFYIHIPFCRQKCPYCKFALTPKFDDLKRRHYFHHLSHEIQSFLDAYSPSWKRSTLYFWWGTPSIMTPEEIDSILSIFHHKKIILDEISFEGNPEDITPDMLSYIWKYGINRLSVGIQSLNEKTLAEIHRSDSSSIYRAMNAIKSSLVGLHSISINIDFILWLPHCKKGETLAGIRTLHTLFPDITHTSVYMLEDERYPAHWKDISLRDEEIREEFCEILDYFTAWGWHHYEVSNFCKPGYECQHNWGYWTHQSYRGFWLSASSYIDGARWSNSGSFSGYYRKEIAQKEILTPQDIQTERIIFWLRTHWCRKDLLKNSVALARFLDNGWLEADQEKIYVTKTWIFLIDHIISELLPSAVSAQ